MSDRSTRYLEAIRRFQYARWQATFEQIFARLRGESSSLLSYDEVRKKLYAEETPRRSLREVPLDGIVGSVGRYADFTRTFLPLHDSAQSRWASIDMQMAGLTGLPPIEVYQIGDVYFVQDGNHRVSVARQMGATSIEAYVTEVQTRVPLDADDSPDDLIIKAEYAEFLQRTRLDELRPEADLRVTAPGRYPYLLAQIELHRQQMQEQQGRSITAEEAGLDWFDRIYYPISRLIRVYGLLEEFPDRTRLDLYAWLLKHQQSLSDDLGWDVAADTAIADIAARYSGRPERVAARLGKRVLDALLPDPFESGPAPGLWRQTRAEQNPRRRLFHDILAPISGQEEHWYALSQALQVAQREQGRVLGLHIVASKADLDSPAVAAIRAQFEQRCNQAGVPARFAVETGGVARVICERARWADLTVIRLVHPPAPNPIARLSSGIRTLLHRCAGPLLVTPRTHQPLRQALLAYNDTPKAREALFVAGYLAQRWGLRLLVLAAQQPGNAGGDLADAQAYLEERGVEAEYLHTDRAIAAAMLQTASDRGCDLIVMGGYSGTPVGEMVRDSAVNVALRHSRVPVLICR